MSKNAVPAAEITSYLAAGYAGFVIQTTEAKRAEQVVRKILKNHRRRDGSTYEVSSWDIDAAKDQNPLSPLKALTDSNRELSVLILHNYHWFVDKPPAIQKIQNDMDSWRNKGKAIIILSPNSKIPVEIRKDFMFLELALPDEEEIQECLSHIAKSAKKPELMDGNNRDVVEACKGLTKTEIENVLALSVTKKQSFDVEIVNDQKIQTIEKSGLIRVLRTDKTYKDILGYDLIKKVVGTMITKKSSKGVLIVGPPGCGKTVFMECTVGEFKKIGLLINFGLLYSKYQGEGQERVEEIIRIIEAVGNCVVIMDEFEKQFAGAASTGETDSGVARRMTGRWLQFMQEKPEGVYLMGTCNSFKGVPDEYRRPGRWDSSPFYIDIPTKAEQAMILDYYIKKMGLPANQSKNSFDMTDWTGAEIEACCLMAKNLNVPLKEASQFIVPQNLGGFPEAEALKKFSIPATSEKIIEAGKRLLDA